MSIVVSAVMLVVALVRPTVGLDLFISGLVLLGWVAGYVVVRWSGRPIALAAAAVILAALAVANSFNYFAPLFLLAFLLVLAALVLGVKRR